MILIGSQAAVYWGIPINRNPMDYDFICTKQELNDSVQKMMNRKGTTFQSIGFEKNKCVVKFFDDINKKQIIFDVSLIDTEGGLSESDKQIYNTPEFYTSATFASIGGLKFYVAYPETLLMMKLSHRYKKNSVFFRKTMEDIKVLRDCVTEDSIWSGEPGEVFTEALKFREKLTYSYSHPKLNQSKQDFFTDSVNYVYDHDTIHEAVKHLDKPAYSYYIEEGAEVKCSKELFDKAPFAVKLYGVLEESYVLALERSVIPFGTDPEKAFMYALEKVCTSITSGWFREFAWENYDAVVKMYHDSYVKRFQSALEQGKIKPFNKEKRYG